MGKQVVTSPYDGAVIGTAAEGGFLELRHAVDAAHHAWSSWRKTSRAERQNLLRVIAASVREREEELASLLTLEVGKPILWSRAEVQRMAITFDLAADLLTTWGVEALPLDTDPRGVGHRGHVERFPRGIIFCIVPYNWPFNLAAHKIAPALATGNTVVLKVSPLAPLSTLTLARIIHEVGAPPGVINAWNGHPRDAQRVLEQDPRIRMLSFTGSAAVGWKLKSLLPRTMVTLELGGNASALVHEDADLDWATSRLVSGGYGYAGQVCIAVQHVMAHRSIYSQLRDQLIAATEKCPTGDPMDPQTICGPLISDEAADRVESLVKEAIQRGAQRLAGGSRDSRVLAPTLLESVPDDCRLRREEVFGPVLTLEPYDTFEEAIARVNRSEYGIHAGIFTHDVRIAESAFRELEVGGVVINNYPTLRFDLAPYGGVKNSGFGREGVRYAMDEMTEPRSLITRTV